MKQTTDEEMKQIASDKVESCVLKFSEMQPNDWSLKENPANTTEWLKMRPNCGGVAVTQ